MFVLFSCKTNQTNSESNESKTEMNKNELVGVKWELEYMSPVNGKNVAQLFKIQKPYLKFVDNDKVAGNNGCNNISGAYSMDGNKITFETDKFAATRMFCEGLDETAFTGILKTINNYEVINDGSKLILLTSDIHSMIFTKVEE